MSFLRVDKDRVKRRGSVFVVVVDGHKVIVGRTAGDSKTGAMLKVAVDYATSKKVPMVQLMKFKKSSDTYRDESFMNSLLYEYIDEGGAWYNVTKETVDLLWREL